MLAFRVPTIFFGQTVVIDLFALRLVRGRPGRHHDDVVGTQFLNLGIRFQGDPFADRQQPDHTGNTDKDARALSASIATDA